MSDSSGPIRIRKCIAPGCSGYVNARDRCTNHYHQLLRAEKRKERAAARDAGRVNMLRMTDGQCLQGPHPCEATACRYNVAGDDRSKDPRSRVPDLSEPCSILVAEQAGPMSLDDVGDFLGLTYERIRVLEETAVRKMAAALREAGWDGIDVRLWLHTMGELGL